MLSNDEAVLLAAAAAALMPMATKLSTTATAPKMSATKALFISLKRKKMIRVALPNGIVHTFDEPEMSAQAALKVLQKTYPTVFETSSWTFATPGLRRSEYPYVLIPAHSEEISAEMVVHWRRVVSNPNAPGGWIFAWLANSKRRK
jgi:hypothetical protein